MDLATVMIATVVSIFVTVGVVCGTVSSWRVGIRWPAMWRSARAWYIAWILLITAAWLF